MTAKTASLARDKSTNRALDDVNEATCGMTEDAREQLLSSNIISQEAPQLTLAFIQGVSDKLRSLSSGLIVINSVLFHHA
jgi:hypothetical protein